MTITSILIILGCAVAGYWVVSSVMGSGIDVIDEGRKAEARKQQRQDQAPGRQPSTSRPGPPLRTAPPVRDAGPMRDWYIVLDVPQNASRAEIQAALKRRLSQAESVGDTAAIARLGRAAETGLAQPR